MKIAVLIKQTFDTEARICLDENGDISDSQIKKIINPFDEYAIEEAVRIKEAGADAVITVISAGAEEAEEALRQALAMGADEAVLLCDPLLAGKDASARAGLIAAYLLQVDFDLLLGGWVSIDDGEAQTAARVAEILDLPQATVVTKLELAEGKATAYRDTADGLETLELPLPAVVTVQRGINEPRYPSFKGIMQSKKMPFKIMTAAELGVAGESKLEILGYEIPVKEKCKLLKGTAQEVCHELVQLLRPAL